ncbi:IS3 OrfA [Salmonella enterica subsp. enterica serovar Agona str. 29.O.08]|nr:IS3 OrfA [Salmonella enterica subsp. enterica serovar Agona str. 29.O.08]
MTKPASTTKKPRKQHTPEFRQEALKLAERIEVAAAARELNLYESQLHNWRSKQQNQLSSSEREQEMSAKINHSSTTGEANSKISSLLLNASRRCPLRSPV